MRPHLIAAVLSFAIVLGLTPGSSPAAEPTGTMSALIAAAKAEGSVIVDGPPVDAARIALTTGFEKRYGIPVTYVAAGGGASGARVRAERAAGKYLLDVFISGSDTPIMTFLPGGWVDKIEPALIAPEVLDHKKWRDGHLWFADPQHMILRVLQFVSVELAINTKLISAKQIPTWKSLLEPKWSGGKLLVKDPTASGSGQSLTSYFYLQFGPEFVRKLYKDQQPTFTADSRQAAQMLAQGNYAVWIGADYSQLAPFIKAGYPIAPIEPSDGPSIITGGFGLVSLMNKPPHPNAAKLFVNWLAGQEGQYAYARAEQAASLRTDVKPDWMPAYQLPHAGRKYYDAYDYNFITVERASSLAKVKELLGF
jgi:iron(III) transport system substrate-binding protein